MSITGIGPVFAAGILSEIGDISYFKSDASLAKYAGFHWKKNDSGNFIADEKHSANSCNKYLKYYITQSTQMSVMHGFDYTTSFIVRSITKPLHTSIVEHSSLHQEN
ncbi:MAG: transposase [Coprobacillus cateniformis]